MGTLAGIIETEGDIDPYAARKALQLATLDRLAAIGMNLAARVSVGETCDAKRSLLAKEIAHCLTLKSRLRRRGAKVFNP